MFQVSLSLSLTLSLSLCACVCLCFLRFFFASSDFSLLAATSSDFSLP